MPPLLANDLVSGGMGDQMGEPFCRDDIAVPDGLFHRLREREKTRHMNLPDDPIYAGAYLRGCSRRVK